MQKIAPQLGLLSFTAISVVLLLIGTEVTRAEWIFYDVVGSLDTAHTANTTDVSYGYYGTAWDTGSDGSIPWRFRNAGPGNAAYNTTAYTAKWDDGDPTIQTTISGLMPDSQYWVRVYCTYPTTTTNGAPRYGAEISLDLGNSWCLVDNRQESEWLNEGKSGEDYQAHPVDNLSGVGTDTVWAGYDTRVWQYANRFNPEDSYTTTDSNGNAYIQTRLPTDGVLSDGHTVDRFLLDGFALSTAIPEPSICALLGLGLSAVVIGKRRG